MPKTRQQKIDTVANFSEKLGRAKSVVLADYKGLTMSQLSDIRQKIAGLDSEFTITKNNLLQISLKDSKIDADPKLLVGPTATLFSYEDEISPIKVLTKALKDFGIGSVKGGFLDGEELSAQQVQKLASLPTKDELLGKVVGALGSPLYGIVSVLQGNLRNLVYTLDQIRLRQLADVKGGE